MMDLDTIHELSAEVASLAAEEGREPLIITAEDLVLCRRGSFNHISIPNLGIHCSDGWTRVDMFAWDADSTDFKAPRGWYPGDNSGSGAWFVDKGGFGGAGEPALSLAEFFEAITAGYGYAMVEEGQFQVKVGVFRKVGIAS